jgi:protein disulfide-isomerase-like protein
MLRFGRAAALPSVLAYATGQVEEELFAAEVPLHLLFFHSAPLAGDVRTALSRAGTQLKGDVVIATVDAGKRPEVAMFFDVAPPGSVATPALLGFSLANGTKFVHKGELTHPAVLGFARAVAAGDVAVHVRSQPRPERGDGPATELVGSTFTEVAHDPAKDVLVQFYSPTCGHCHKLKPVFNAVAEQFAKDEEMVVAQMDAIANDVPGLEPDGFPTIVLYTKANKRGLVYDGSRDAHDLVQFVTDARAGRNQIGGLPGRQHTKAATRTLRCGAQCDRDANDDGNDGEDFAAAAGSRSEQVGSTISSVNCYCH